MIVFISEVEEFNGRKNLFFNIEQNLKDENTKLSLIIRKEKVNSEKLKKELDELKKCTKKLMQLADEHKEHLETRHHKENFKTYNKQYIKDTASKRTNINKYTVF